MIYIIVISLLIVIGALYGLYLIGKDVKKKEKEIKTHLKMLGIDQKLKSYSRKSTPKVPARRK